MVSKKREDSKKRPIESYDHKDKDRLNNPPVGLVSIETDKDQGKTKYSYDPHLDPQLIWAGKVNHVDFEVPTVSLHVHERIDSKTIVDVVRKKNGGPKQDSFFEMSEENPPLRHAIEFYSHPHNWSNRIIAGDSLLVMNSLIEKEGMAGKVQMVYIDPPYGIKYGSNFQPFINKLNVMDGKDNDLNREPEMVRAFRDTWELGIHSYLSYLRDRLFLVKDMLQAEGSCFVQTSDENEHRVRLILDEIFGSSNFVCNIRYRTRTMTLKGSLLDVSYDHILWYGKHKPSMKYRPLFMQQDVQGDINYRFVELNDGTRRELSKSEINNHGSLPKDSRVYRLLHLKPTQYRKNQDFNFMFKGVTYPPPGGNVHKTPDGVHSWATTEEGMKKLEWSDRLQASGNTVQYILYHDDYPVTPINSIWSDTASERNKIYVVQTNDKVIARCILMTTDPGDLVFDPTCGSGTSAYVAELWGRRWITCDTSRISIALAKQRLMTTIYDYYELLHPDEGVSNGLNYKKVPHVTLKSITNNSDICDGMTRLEIERAVQKYSIQETLYDDPVVEKSKVRVTGPFTVEAVPAPVVKPLDELHDHTFSISDSSIARDGETLRQAKWRDELSKTGVRGKGGQRIEFSRMDVIPTCRWLHADGETKEDIPQRVVVSFGSAYAPLEQRQVELALEEAQHLIPKPTIIIFATFQFDPEASKDIDEIQWSGVSLLKAQMNADLLIGDLKKKRRSNESFWLIGQPDISLSRILNGDHKGKWQVEVIGFDYYNIISGKVESGGTDRIAMWMLDTDYDGRSLFPRQVFFPMADDKGGWARLSKNLKAEIDEELIEQYRGTVSLPFKAGDNNRVAVKIIDDRGIESLKIMGIDQ